MNTNQTTQKYFDLHVTGIGYLNRAREVPVKRGASFFAVDIAALHGVADQVEYTKFDCRVSGVAAIDLITKYMDRINRDETKVLIGFKLGDLYAETFEYKKGEKAGQTGVSLKARLLRIAWIKVDGQTVYTAPKAESAGETEPETEHSELDAFV